MELHFPERLAEHLEQRAARRALHRRIPLDDQALLIGQGDAILRLLNHVAELALALAQRFLGLALLGDIFANHLVFEQFLMIVKDGPVGAAQPAQRAVWREHAMVIGGYRAFGGQAQVARPHTLVFFRRNELKNIHAHQLFQRLGKIAAEKRVGKGQHTVRLEAAHQYRHIFRNVAVALLRVEQTLFGGMLGQGNGDRGMQVLLFKGLDNEAKWLGLAGALQGIGVRVGRQEDDRYVEALADQLGRLCAIQHAGQVNIH